MDKKVQLELTLEETNLILSALGKLPLEQALNVFAKVKQTAEEQLKPQEANG